MPQAEYQIFQNFQKFSPGRCPQATPQGKPKFAYALGLCLGQLFAPYLALGPQALLQATPQGYNGLRQTISFWIPVSLFILVP
ncbi:hypothetical protein T4B_5023, partial [Trichinella pseudospiralis]